MGHLNVVYPRNPFSKNKHLMPQGIVACRCCAKDWSSLRALKKHYRKMEKK